LNGSARAEFTEFAHSRWPRLVRLGYGLTGDAGLAEDLAQTALANAYASWSRVRRADDPDAYVRRILLNSYRSTFRKRRVAEELRPTMPDAPSGGHCDCGPEFADPASWHEDRAGVLAAVAALPPKQREVILLRYWMDLTDAQIAGTLGCSVGNVKSQSSRALAKLRISAELADWRA
jgi:RNA polymerase sigma-70 factor (sigma-E family)